MQSHYTTFNIPLLDYKITEEDIRKNTLYLCDELEPKQYLEMVKGIDRSDDVCDKIIEAASRETRCKVMIDFIMKSCQSDSSVRTLNKFSQSLQKWNPDVLQYILETRKSEQKERKYSLLIKEIDFVIIL